MDDVSTTGQTRTNLQQRWPDEKVRALKIQAAVEGRSMTEVLQDAFDRYMAQQPSPLPSPSHLQQETQ